MSVIQAAVGDKLMISVYKEVVEKVAERVKSVEMANPVTIKVREMPVEGRAKIRHVGAWAVAKVFHAKLKYVKLHMTSQIQTTQEKVRKSLAMSGLLEEYIIANFSKLEQTSVHQETLMVTEERQYRCRGFSHIEDAAYEFFLDLEQIRVDNLNENKLHARHQNLIVDAIEAVKGSQDLRTKWRACFPVKEVEHI